MYNRSSLDEMMLRQHCARRYVDRAARLIGARILPFRSSTVLIGLSIGASFPMAAHYTPRRRHEKKSAPTHPASAISPSFGDPTLSSRDVLAVGAVPQAGN